MKCAVIQSTYASSNGVNTVNYYIYRNEEVPLKGIVQISHGMCEYFLRYDHFARFLADNGYLVCGNDHLGHGNTIKKYDDLGFFAEKNGWHFLVEDIHQLTMIMRRQYPGIPLVLLGHSMGSFIARMFLDMYSRDVDGAILSGTGENPMAPAGIAVAACIKKLRGGRYRSETIKKMAVLNSPKHFPEHYSEFDWLTKDRKVIDDYMQDKKCNFTFTISGYIDLFSMVMHCSSSNWGTRIRKDLPVYIFSGDNDPVGDFGKGVKKVYHHLNKVGIQDVSLRLYEKGRHEMLNEINRDEVYQYVLKWLNTKVAVSE